MPQHCHGRLRLTNEPSARQPVRRPVTLSGVQSSWKSLPNQGYGVVVVEASPEARDGDFLRWTLQPHWERSASPRKKMRCFWWQDLAKSWGTFFRTWATISSKLWKQILKLKQIRCEWTLHQHDSNQRTKWTRIKMNQHTNCWKNTETLMKAHKSS